jgi:mannosyltransferase
LSSVPARQRGESAPVTGPPGRAAAGPPDKAGTGGFSAAAARYLPAAAAAAVMLIAGLWGLARQSSMGNDEVATRWAALLSLRQLEHLLRNLDAVHGLYYLFMHAWMAVGSSPTVMRIPSVVAMVGAAAMIAIAARQLTGSGWAGLFAGLIMALTPTISFYAQTARSYALVYACVVGSTLVLLHALRAEAARAGRARLARRWLAYGVLVTLGGYLNELSLLVLAAHAVTVLLARYGRRAVVHWAGTAVVGAALVGPLVLISHREDAAVGWIPRPGLADLRVLFHDYFGATTAVAILLGLCAVAAVLPARGQWRRLPAGPDAAPGAAPQAGVPPAGQDSAADAEGASLPARAEPGSAWWRRGGITLPSVAVPLLVGPALLLILESLVTRPLYVDRYVLYGEAGAALLAGGGLYRIGRWLGEVASRRTLVWLPAAVVCLCALVVQLGPQQRVRTPQSRLFDFGGPSRYVGAHARPGDGVLFFTAFYRKARLGYPADFRQVDDFGLAVSPARAGTFQGVDKPFAQARPLLLAHRRIWVVGRPPSAQLPGGPYRAESSLLLQRFTLVGERHFRGMIVTLWARR